MALFSAWRDAFLFINHWHIFEPQEFDCVADGD
jgi:hypothetical protein